MFKTMPIEPLYNLTRISSISYLLPKLMHAYSYKLWGLPPNAKVCTILMTDQCRYWPSYIISIINLSQASADLGTSIYHPLGLCTARLWEAPHLTYLLNPSPSVTSQYRESVVHQNNATTHIFVTLTTYNATLLATYHIIY